MTRTIRRSELSSIRAVCIGGGTGVPASIRALVSLGIRPDAVVSVADDGGSSGLLRMHTGRVPPGDLRKCLVALARDQKSPWVRAFKERFEYANDHTLGNLVLTALQETTDSLTESIALCEQLLDTVGHVHPASLECVLLMGVTQDGQRIVGQSRLCKSETALADVALDPKDPQANPAAAKAIEEADLLVFGPGSLFTSIIPNTLIPGINAAVRRSAAATVFVCPLTDTQGETWGLDAAELTEALLAHGLDGRLDYVLINRQEAVQGSGNVTSVFSAISPEAPSASFTDKGSRAVTRPLVLGDASITRIREHGVKVLVRRMNDQHNPSWHGAEELGRAFASIIADSKSP